MTSRARSSSSSPIALTRRHTAGQRYAITMLHTGVVTSAYDAEATVTSATPGEIRLELTIKSMTVDGDPRLTDAEFAISVDPVRRSVDAEQVSGPGASLYLTAIEAMLGAVCWTPAEPHRPGDAWVERNTSWQLVGVSERAGREYVHYRGEAGTPGSGRSYELELAADDAYSGTCTVDTRITLAGEVNGQRYRIAVTRLHG